VHRRDFCKLLAIAAASKTVPSRLPDKDYVGEFTPNWFERAEAKRHTLLDDISPHLDDSSPDSVMRFTMGKGGAGIEREAYYAGWLVIGDLLQRGWTYPRLARVTDDQMTRIVADSLTHMLNGRP
jgi:hypothetical protein